MGPAAARSRKGEIGVRDWRDLRQRGQGLVEYALILVLIVIALVIAVAIFGGNLYQIYSLITSSIPH